MKAERPVASLTSPVNESDVVGWPPSIYDLNKVVTLNQIYDSRGAFHSS